jgi:hypothetical protein
MAVEEVVVEAIVVGDKVGWEGEGGAWLNPFFHLYMPYLAINILSVHL